jgi:hypothetical protein
MRSYDVHRDQTKAKIGTTGMGAFNKFESYLPYLNQKEYKVISLQMLPSDSKV